MSGATANVNGINMRWLDQGDDSPVVLIYGWDIHGASAAGMRTGFVRRNGRSFPGIMTKPELDAENLTDLINQLLTNDRE